MKRVYSNNNVAMVWHVRNMLEAQNIEVQVRNDRLYTIVGEVPVTECMAEVWVVKPLSYRFAEQLIAEMESGESGEFSAWKCQHCGESNEGNFALCWNCQRAFAVESA